MKGTCYKRGAVFASMPVRAHAVPRRRLAALLLIWLIGAALTATAVAEAPEGRDPGVFRRLASAEGLINNVVYGVVQDSRGFMWLGTEGGLVRYDGREFRSFEIGTDTEGTPARKDISTLHRGSNDVVWVGTWGAGLVQFDPVSERTRRFQRNERDPQSLSDDRVQTIFEDRSGRLWVGTFNGLNRLSGKQGSFARFMHTPGDPASLSHSRIWSISQAPDGLLWVGTDAGVDVLDSAGLVVKRFTLPGRADGDDRRARVVFHDRAGVLWVGAQHGVHRLDAATGSLRPLDVAGASLQDAIITGMVEGPDRSLWVGGLGAGLARVSPARDAIVRYPPDPWHPGRLAHGDVRALWVDRTGLLWVGTRGGGVNLLDLRSPVVQLVGHAFGAAESWTQEVASVYVDSKGELWAGSLEGLRHWDASGREHRYTHDPARRDTISPDLVRDIVEDGRGRYWVATLNGLDRLDPRTGRFEHFRHDPSDPSSLSHNRVNALLVDRRGRLWIGTQGGLSRLDKDASRFERFKSGDLGLSDDFVRVLLEDRAGTVWLGTEVGGVCRWRDAEGRFDCFRRGRDEATLSDDRVFSMYESDTGPIWVGTDNGLNQLDPKTARITRLGDAAGVPTDDVYGLLGDRYGALWISSGRGLYWFDPRTGRSRMFTEAEGLRGIAFSRGACAAARDGSLYFGALSGVIRAWPDRVQAAADPPPVAVTDVVVDETRLAEPLGTMTELNLPWRVTSFRVAFAALDYRHADVSQYRYRLEAFETKWRLAGPDAAAVYTNLDAGDYVLHVRAANGAGVWTEQGLALPIHIRPPWWETLVFRFGLFLLITTITATIVVARLAMLKRGQRELGRLVDERTGQLVEANHRLEQLARTDGLTGLSNYRAFTETLEGEWSRNRREGRPLSVAMVDVDRFKAYNDTFGHRAGDEALRRVAGAIGALGKRDGDVVARYGGDEFSMVLVGSDRHGAVRVAERARQAVEELDLLEPGSTLERLTLSIGVATTVPSAHTTTEDLLRAADQALYEAKRRGRNCVVARVLVPSPAPTDGRLEV
jgi:diguanylate cyclase (GGDEF)-like protein